MFPLNTSTETHTSPAIEQERGRERDRERGRVRESEVERVLCEHVLCLCTPCVNVSFMCPALRVILTKPEREKGRERAEER